MSYSDTRPLTTQEIIKVKDEIGGSEWAEAKYTPLGDNWYHVTKTGMEVKGRNEWWVRLGAHMTVYNECPESKRPDIADIHWATAVKMIKDCDSLDQLEAWGKDEMARPARQSVVNALVARVEDVGRTTDKQSDLSRG